MKKIKWWIRNWPEAFIALDLWASEYPRRKKRSIKLLCTVIRPITKYGVSKWDNVG